MEVCWITTALVTGVTGFVGSRLAARLIEKGYDVFGLVRPCASRDLKPIEPIQDDLTLISGDLTNLSSVANVLRNSNPDIVFHLGALSPVRYSFEHPFQYQDVNFVGTMNIAHSLMELSDSKKRRLLTASTAEVYGIQAERPFREDMPLEPSSPYAVSKAAMDMYLRMAARVFGLNCVIMRPANSYGRRYEKNFLVEYLITSMLSEHRVYVGAPDSIRDYIHIEDHVEAYTRVAEKECAPGEVFNIGSGRGISNRQLALMCSDFLHFDPKNIEFGAYPPGYPMRPLASDQPYIVLDSAKARKTVGWSCRIQLEQGLRMVADFWRPLVTPQSAAGRT